MHLVGVVISPGCEDDMEAHVEIAVIDRPLQAFLQHAACEEHRSGVARQVFLACLHEPRSTGCGGFLEREIYVVGKQTASHSCTFPRYHKITLAQSSPKRPIR